MCAAIHTCSCFLLSPEIWIHWHLNEELHTRTKILRINEYMINCEKYRYMYTSCRWLTNIIFASQQTSWDQLTDRCIMCLLSLILHICSNVYLGVIKVLISSYSFSHIICPDVYDLISMDCDHFGSKPFATFSATV